MQGECSEDPGNRKDAQRPTGCLTGHDHKPHTCNKENPDPPVKVGLEEPEEEESRGSKRGTAMTMEQALPSSCNPHGLLPVSLKAESMSRENR